MIRNGLAAAALVAAFVFGLGAGACRADEAAEKAETAKIDAAAAAYVKAYNAGDADAVAKQWAEDADFIDHRSRTHKGRDAIGALFRKAFDANRGYQMKLTVSQRRFLAPTVVLEDGVMELARPKEDAVKGRYVTVWEKKGDAWLFRSVRDIPFDEDEKPADDANPLAALEWLTGSWVDKPDSPTVKLSCQWKAGKKFLVQDYEVKSDGEPLTITIWTGWDPSTRQVRSWFFDSSGGFGTGVWQKRDETWKVTTSGVVADGRFGSSVYVWTKLKDGLEWKATEREVDGHAVPDATVKFVKAK